LKARSGLPLVSYAGQPPSVDAPRLEVLVRTPVWWGYCPVKKLERDTQHSESVTNECG
jgi:hypothetical protein